MSHNQQQQQPYFQLKETTPAIAALLSPRPERANMQFDHLEPEAKFPNEYGYTIGPQNNKKVLGLSSGYNNRERLLNIHKRETLKGLLVNKFRNKYGLDKKPHLQAYIANEVTKFLSSERLTEDNLRHLDNKIAREADNRDRKETILDDRRSTHSGAFRNGGNQTQSANYIPELVTSPKTARIGDKLERISTASSAKQFFSPRLGANEASRFNDADRVSVSAVSARQSVAGGNILDRKSRRVISIASQSMTSSK